ncbi:hypothetical protein GCM10010269_32800 [Streptomyces humidus]|uniref:Uncharacterized protein n=1 Tax=Streptomyces humidus TaxID=52259 RepID=A0A918FWT0_9ACTN|nr:hypothetical protein GCM10010269_32800 [Streptomyces humidus]
MGGAVQLGVEQRPFPGAAVGCREIDDRQLPVGRVRREGCHVRHGASVGVRGPAAGVGWDGARVPGGRREGERVSAGGVDRGGPEAQTERRQPVLVTRT